ncbi:MAG: hypothetical protein V8R88_01025 [Faecalibacterium prausnitzii]
MGFALHRCVSAAVDKMLHQDGEHGLLSATGFVRTPGFVPESVKNIADASGFVKIRQKACNLTKKRQISMNISPRVYILHEEA